MGKKNTFMSGPTKVYYPDTPLIEAAKFLASTARRFAQRKATVGDVEVAITEWRSALNDPMVKRQGDS